MISMPVFRDCPNYDACIEHRNSIAYFENLNKELNILNCEGCQTFGIYKKGFEDGVKALASKLNKLSQEGAINIEIR